MATILFGYDVERFGDPSVTRAFLASATEVHRRTGTRATLFVVGRTLEESPDDFRRALDTGLFDMQQHTYSHVLLKSVSQVADGVATYYPGGSLDQIRDEVNKASEALARLTGVRPQGLCGPYCYYRGLSDRHDILGVLWEAGIRFTRTWGRDSADWQPVDHALQPFWYEPQGFPEILEIPLQGWQDCIVRDLLGWSDLDGYVAHLNHDLEAIRGAGLVWSYCQHDWSSVREDPAMTATERFIEDALAMDIGFETHADFRQAAAAARQI